jgi:hypothetical protein
MAHSPQAIGDGPFDGRMPAESGEIEGCGTAERRGAGRGPSQENGSGRPEVAGTSITDSPQRASAETIERDRARQGAAEVGRNASGQEYVRSPLSLNPYVVVWSLQAWKRGFKAR